MSTDLGQHRSCQQKVTDLRSEEDLMGRRELSYTLTAQYDQSEEQLWNIGTKTSSLTDEQGKSNVLGARINDLNNTGQNQF